MEFLLYGLLAVFLLVTIGMVCTLYQKCGPNEAMIISGAVNGTGPHRFKVVQGGGTVVVPLIQRKDILSLEVMTIDVQTNAPIITKSGVPIFVEGVAQVKVEGNSGAIATAAEQFLGKNTSQIAGIAHETLVGHLRAILGTMEVEELIQSFEDFAQKVQEVSINDLAKMGLTVVSFTIKEIRDEVGYIENLGRDRTAEIRRNADIGVANKTKETAIAKAIALSESMIVEAQKAQESSRAQILAETQIAEASKVMEVQKAEYLAQMSSKKAVSDLTYNIVRAQTEQKLIEEQQKIKIVEAQKSVELQAIEVQRKQVALEADITKPAEAELIRVRILTQAEGEKRKVLAEADACAARMRATVEADATKLKAAAEAEAIRCTGLAQAEVIGAQGEAEAEAMYRKAEALRRYNDAALSSMLIDKLPEIVAAAAAPLAKIGQMTVLTSGGETGAASRITQDVLGVAAQSLTMIKGLTGIDLTAKLRSLASDDNGIKADVNLLRNGTSIDSDANAPRISTNANSDATAPRTTANVNSDATAPRTTANVNPDANAPRTTANVNPDANAPRTIANVSADANMPRTATSINTGGNGADKSVKAITTVEA